MFAGLPASKYEKVTSTKATELKLMNDHVPETSSQAICELRQVLTSALVCDALDQAGRRNQSPRIPFQPVSGTLPLIGRCRTTLWVDMDHEDTNPYALELDAVDGCKPDDVLICAAHGSMRSGIWGELLSTAARNQGCIGAIVDGAVRDTRQMNDMGFTCLARGVSPYDSLHRQRVVDVDVPVEIDGVCFEPGSLVVADADGVVVVPRSVEAAVTSRAWAKMGEENRTRDAISEGMLASEAYAKYGVL